MKHPMQPIFVDDDKIVRFKPNKIVRFLIDWGQNHGMSLNDLALLPFDREDREQLAQLIGYSVSGFCDLSYASDEAKDKATELADKLMQPKE